MPKYSVLSESGEEGWDTHAESKSSVTGGLMWLQSKRLVCVPVLFHKSVPSPGKRLMQRGDLDVAGKKGGRGQLLGCVYNERQERFKYECVRVRLYSPLHLTEGKANKMSAELKTYKLQNRKKKKWNKQSCSPTEEDRRWWYCTENKTRVYLLTREEAYWTAPKWQQCPRSLQLVMWPSSPVRHAETRDRFAGARHGFEEAHRKSEHVQVRS